MLKYQKAERALKSSTYLLSDDALPMKSRSEGAQKTLKMCVLLDPKTIKTHIEASCSRGSQEHACKNLFKENHNLVKNWRILWASLPKQSRMSHLMSAISKTGEFFFLGVKVCALAFMQLTGVSAGTLQMVRESRDNVIRPSGKILGSWMGVAANSKPNRYLEC